MNIETAIHGVIGITVNPILERTLDCGHEYTNKVVTIETVDGNYHLNLFGATADDLTITNKEVTTNE